MNCFIWQFLILKYNLFIVVASIIATKNKQFPIELCWTGPTSSSIRSHGKIKGFFNTTLNMTTINIIYLNSYSPSYFISTFLELL